MRWILLLFLVSCSKPSPPAASLPYVKVAQPILRDTPIYLEYVGHVEPNQKVDVKAQVEGVLTGQYFVEGQEVAKNSLLMTIDPRSFQAEVQRTQGVLAQNLATLQQTKDTLARYQQLVAQHYVSQLDYDRFATDVLTAEASVQEARGTLEEALINLEYCTIYAPFQGVASKLAIDVGNYISSATSDPTLFTINQISPIRVSFYVPEKDLAKIASLQANRRETVFN